MKLEKAAQELMSLKEEMKRKLNAANNVSVDEMDHLVKSIPTAEQLSNCCFDASFKRDDASVAILLIRAQSRDLLESIYQTWPFLSFEVPSDNAASSIASNVDLQSTGANSVVATSLATKPSLKSIKSVTYIDLSSRSGATVFPNSKATQSSDATMMRQLEYLTGQQEALQFQYAKDIDVTGIDFTATRTLRKVGFKLLQLRDSKAYSWNQLLAAGYPLNEIKHLRGSTNYVGDNSSFELTVPELRKAGYSIEQCVKAGFDLPAIKAGGFDELQLVQSGLFSGAQLKRAGCDVQRYALRMLFESTDGRHWRNKTNWCTTRPLEEWYGIQVDPRGNVVKIDLRSNELHGHLPEALYLLNHLTYLDFYNNSLYGDFPVLYKNLTNLRDLWLDGTNRISAQKAQIQKLLPNCRIRL
jgi:hypothetical protein